MTGEGLREARKAAGLSQAELAEKIGMSRETVGQMERGQAPIEVRTELAIKQALLPTDIYEDWIELPGLPTKEDMLRWRAILAEHCATSGRELVGVFQSADGPLMRMTRKKGRTKA